MPFSPQGGSGMLRSKRGAICASIPRYLYVPDLYGFGHKLIFNVIVSGFQVGLFRTAGVLRSSFPGASSVILCIVAVISDL